MDAVARTSSASSEEILSCSEEGQVTTYRAARRVSRPPKVDVVAARAMQLGESPLSSPLSSEGPLTASSAHSVDFRHPPINPRTSRRKCLHLGFRREQDDDGDSDVPTTPETARSQLSPVKDIFPDDEPAYDSAGSESEEEASSLKDFDLDFPNPPSFSSPMLRRMQSSPSFGDMHKRALMTRAPAPLSSQFPQPPGSAYSLSKHLSLGASSPVSTNSNLIQDIAGGMEGLCKELEFCDSPMANTLRFSTAPDMRSPVVNPHPYASGCPTMVADITPTVVIQSPSESKVGRTLHKMRSLKFHPSTSNDKPMMTRRTLDRGRSISMDCLKTGSPPPASRSNRRLTALPERSSSRTASYMLSSRSSSFFGPKSSDSDMVQPRTVSAPEYPSSRSVGYQHEKDGLQSFMEMTPERKKRGHLGSRERASQLWSKASKGIMGWATRK
ncbi:hypothetical protein CYLTODRAFT_1915 [Cylindrobasidium torrendii FP15055 ss-10]|uniref:Uncharacterized protein n=1 Tax=Cylindrobasidium torrendii FP15055 ss-10 TaxID=1314674 RepID=A0A0D7BV69_9AGAR|nr:hypothetical protein CYLTODRAFT_1915 [Cylindrobasidium torrendii FP15055 ss-10]